MNRNMKPNQHSEITFASKAFCSLGACAVRIRDCPAKLFEHGFNNWYCPAIRRGYQGPMFVIYDLGIMWACLPQMTMKSGRLIKILFIISPKDV